MNLSPIPENCPERLGREQNFALTHTGKSPECRLEFYQLDRLNELLLAMAGRGDQPYQMIGSSQDGGSTHIKPLKLFETRRNH